ncbi:MAG: MFS transporter [Thermomicrobiales bacterium]
MTSNAAAAANRADVGRLWRDADFFKLWAALSISLVGTEITALALPLIAALTLGASPLQMGLLVAAGRAPFFLVSLPAGVWADRVRRRPLLIGTDLGCALLLVSVPAASILGTVHFAQLCVVAFGVGALGVLGEVAHYAYAPWLIGRQRLVEGNSKFQISHSAANSAGPGLAGLLIQLVSAPFAVLADAASYLASAFLVSTIGRREPPPEQPTQREPLTPAIAAGLRALLGHPLLRPIVLASTMISFFGDAVVALYLLYATRQLGLGPATIGLIFAAGGACAIPGAMLAPWSGRRFGVGPAIVTGWTVAALAGLLVPLAAGPPLAVVAILTAARALGGATDTVANIHQWTLRQAVTPDHLQARVTASHRFIVYGAGAFGALLGGVLGAALGLRPALLACTIATLLGPLVAAASPLRRLRHQPADAVMPAG